MRGWIVYNAFLGEKFSEQVAQLIAAMKKAGCELIPKRNTELMYIVGSGGMRLLGAEPLPELVLFWDKDIRLAQALESMGLRLFNSSRAIELCDDKSLTHFELQKAGIPMPDTIIVPKTFEGVGYGSLDFLAGAAEALGFPMVVKEWFGSFGQQVYLAENMEQLCGLVRRTSPRPLLLQRMVTESRGEDVRINVVGGKVAAAMRRRAKAGDFRSNVSNGGTAEAYEPDDEQKALAIRCCELLGLDFGGVDILFGRDGPIVCEVNSNAHMKNIRAATGIDVAECIAEHIVTTMSGGRRTL